MSDDVQAALHAMTQAEIEAKRYADPSDARKICDWARDRVALVARDRATLQRHEMRLWAMADRASESSGTTCGVCVGIREWPCPDARAVVEFWTDQETRR